MSTLVPAWLDAPPEEGLTTLPVNTRIQTLPFGELTWRNFERLILRLVRKQENVIDCALYGTDGQAQEGLDILAVDTDTKQEKVTCYQCKKVDKFDASGISNAVNKFLEGKWVDKSSKFVLCVASSLNGTQQQNEILKQRDLLKRHEITLAVWDGSSGGVLSEMLKCLPDLVDDFFGRPWVEKFNGEAAVASLSKRLDGNELGKLRQRMNSLYSTVFNQHDLPRPTISLDSDLRTCIRSYKRGGTGYVQRKEWGRWGREGSP